jgi:hypothetical protein
MVVVINPAVTTAASGRCTSVPISVASAIGTKPSDAPTPEHRTQPLHGSIDDRMVQRRASFQLQPIAGIISSPFSTAIPDKAMSRPTTSSSGSSVF